MKDFLSFACPDVGVAEKKAVADALSSGWITTGPKTKEFEERFSEFVGASNAVAVNSCTAAMHLALEAIGVCPGDEVIIPTMTFAATGEVVRYLGARPVLVDVLPGDHNIDPSAVADSVSDRTKAIIPVHFAGQSAEMDSILELARRYSLFVVEDAAHAIPARFGDKNIGTIGDIACFSFYATKPITTGEGGMAVTDNPQFSDRMRVMSLHGISKDAWKRYSAEGSWYYEIIAPGFKYNMTDIAAAMGLVQLDRAREMLARRRDIARAYTEAFGGLDKIELLYVREFDAHAWHLFVIRLVDGKAKIDRNALIEKLKADGIGTSVHFIPLHMHPYYRKTYGYEPADFPVAKDIFERCISLPIYSTMSDADIDRVIKSVCSHI